MNLKDFAKFKKLMQMTFSPQDSEALTAIRMANALLLADNRNWEELIDGKVTKTVQQPYQNPGEKPGHTKPPMGGRDDAEHIQEMFEQLYRTVKPVSKFRAFLDSVYDQWEKKQWLSDRQYEVISQAYERSWTDV